MVGSMSDTAAVVEIIKMAMDNNVFEPPHDKTNKMARAPSESQISLGIRPV